jgi:hypothetical protein
MKKKAFVGIRSYYYKSEAAEAVLDHAHALRCGVTNSENVHKQYSAENEGFYYNNAKSCAEALDLMCQKHKELTGKKVRSDCNVLFEHVVWLSEHQYTRLEQKYGTDRVKHAFLSRLKQYAESVKAEFGFEPLGIDIHLDEGYVDPFSNRLIRNVHAHVQFMNYSFEKRYAPLRHMMKNGLNEQGQTNSLNPNFEKLQDLVSIVFKDMGFTRGISKNITSREHLKKEDFVKQKQQNLESQVAVLEEKEVTLAQSVSQKQTVVKELDKTINNKHEEISWLESKIKRLLEFKNELSNAVVSKCRQKISLIMRNTISIRNHSKTPKI